MENQDGKVEVRVAQDGLKAFIRIIPSQGGVDSTVESALSAMRKEDIVFGINENEIQKSFAEFIYDKDIPVAFGIPPEHGNDAEIKILFSTKKEVKPKEDEKGNVDYKNVKIIENCIEGEKLAEIIPETKGKNGKGVNGKNIMAKDGRPARLPMGRNTQPSPENPNLLVAMLAGSVTFIGSLIEVEPVYVINGDVDFSMGNVDYVGALVVKGDVKSGFTVKCKGDMEVWGVVEDAEVISESNIMLKSGIAGRGNGKIIADGDVYVKFCENQSIISKRDIIVGEELMHSRVEADGKIILKGKKGLIVGGSVTAINGIEAKTIGNYQHVKTEIVAGINQALMDKMKKNEEELKKNIENFENVKKAVYSLVKYRISQGGLNPEKQALLLRLQKLQELLPKQCEQLEQEKVRLEDEIEKHKGVTITVKQKVYPGVRINIQKFKKTIHEELENVVFAVEDNEIIY